MWIDEMYNSKGLRTVKGLRKGVWSILSLCLVLTSFTAQSEVLITTSQTVDSNDTSLHNQDIVVDGATLTINGTHSFNSLQLKNGAVLTHSTASSDKLAITVTDLLSIDDTSAIDLAGRGQGFLAGTQYYAGGSYGGRGGFHGNYVSASEYGNYAEPAELGSGGRDGNTGTYRGGGAIK